MDAAAKVPREQTAAEAAAAARPIPIPDVIAAFGPPMTAREVLALQRAAGNRATVSALADGCRDRLSIMRTASTPPVDADRVVRSALRRAVVQRQEHGDGAIATQSTDPAADY